MNTHSLLFLKSIVIACALLTSAHSFANDNAELKKASSAACNKLKMCIKKQTSEEQDLSPEMVKMIDKIAENSCKSLYEINELTAYDNLLEPITKCYQAMANSSCEELQNGHQPKACVELEKAVENL